MDNDRIVVEGVGKRYGELQALDAVTLEISAGEVFGLLGPNGAGKTTLMKILMGMTMATAGSARILGLDCFVDRVALKRLVGYLPDTPFFYDYLTGWELIRFVADMHGLAPEEAEPRAARLFEELELSEAANDFVTRYSLGMKKKMALAQALVHEPRVLILDEPTTALDPRSSRHIRELVRRYADGGRLVLLSTHWLELAESLCDRVGIIHRGRLVATGKPAELRARGEAPESGDRSLEHVFLELTSEPEPEPERARA